MKASCQVFSKTARDIACSLRYGGVQVQAVVWLSTSASIRPTGQCYSKKSLPCIDSGPLSNYGELRLNNGAELVF